MPTKGKARHHGARLQRGDRDQAGFDGSSVARCQIEQDRSPVVEQLLQFLLAKSGCCFAILGTGVRRMAGGKFEESIFNSSMFPFVK